MPVQDAFDALLIMNLGRLLYSETPALGRGQMGHALRVTEAGGNDLLCDPL
jgi:hypothetical protein